MASSKAVQVDTKSYAALRFTLLSQLQHCAKIMQQIDLMKIEIDKIKQLKTDVNERKILYLKKQFLMQSIADKKRWLSIIRSMVQATSAKLKFVMNNL